MDLESQNHIYNDAIFTMLASSLDGFTLVNSSGFIIDANNSYCQLLGYTREELLKMHLSEIDAIDSVEDVTKRSAEIMLRGSLRFETKHLHNNGSVIDVEVTANYTRLHGGLLFSCVRDITKQKQAAKATLLSQERYKNIVESQAEFVDRYTHGGILTYVNPSLAKFTGIEADALLGHSFYNFIHESDRDACVSLIESISAANPTVEVNGQIVLPDGTSRWVHWSQTGLFDENDNLIEYQAVGKDVTDQRLAEIRLQESEQKYRLIFENAGDSISVMDLQGKLLAVNPLACNMLGYTYDELISLSADRIDARPYDMAANVLTLVETGYYSGETEFIRKDGTTLPISVDARKIVWEGQDAILSICRDITARKRIEENLKNSEQALRSIVDANPEPHFLIDRNETVLMANRSLAKRLGKDVSEVEGHNLVDLGYPALYGRRKSAVEEVFRSGNSYFFTESHDGRELENYINPVFHQNGQVAQVAILSIDVTEKNLKNRQLINAQKLENFGIIASGFAHNFNNALTSVLGYIELSLRSVDKSHKAHDLLTCAEDAAKSAVGIVSQLMICSKEYRGIRKMPMSVVPIAEECVFLSTTGSKVKSRLIFSPGLHDVLGDEKLIRIAFRCICNNAVQAMPEGGTLTVKGRNVDTGKEKLPVLAEGKYVEISFEDQGCGIEKNDRAKIFTPYYTHKAEIGAGLGLSTVHSVITRHGGEVTFVSKAGKGTTFTLYLPAVAGPMAL